MLFSCTQKAKEEVLKKKIESNDTFSKLSYAKNFKIIKHRDFTEIQIIDPETGGIEKKYAVSPIVNLLKIDANYNLIQSPIKSIFCLTGTDIGMIEKLGQASKISGITNQKYIYNPLVKKSVESGNVLEINNLNQVNPELLLGKTKLISYSGFGTPPQNEDKLAKLGILCLPNYDWRENHPLGKAEWIKVFAILLGKEKEGKDYFEKISKEYKKLSFKAKKLKKNTTTVLSGSMYGDSWFMPAGESFNAQLFNKSNCHYVNRLSSGTGSTAFTFEQVLKNFQNTKFWINPGFKSKDQLLSVNEKYKYFEAFKKDQIYCYSHKINYFWEMSAIEPQKVLSDYIQIFHQGEVKKQKLYFYKKLD